MIDYCHVTLIEARAGSLVLYKNKNIFIIVVNYFRYVYPSWCLLEKPTLVTYCEIEASCC